MESIIFPCYHPLGDDPRLVLQIRYTPPLGTMAGHDVWPGCRHRKGDKHGTDDHSRTGRNRGWTQARVDDPRDRSLREEATADHNKRDQGQKDRLEQGLQGDELDMQVVRRVQAHARLRHELRHGQVVQELPPVLPPVPASATDARTSASATCRRSSTSPRSPRPTASRSCTFRAATSTPLTKCSLR